MIEITKNIILLHGSGI